MASKIKRIASDTAAGPKQPSWLHRNASAIAAVSAVAAVLVALAAFVIPLSPSPDPLEKKAFLSEIPFKLVKGMEPHGVFDFNKPYFFNRIQIDGVPFEHGPVMHARKHGSSRIEFDVSGLGSADEFRATVGLNDEPSRCSPEGGSTGTVVFEIFLDGEAVEKPIRIIRGPGRNLRIPLPPGQQSTLLLQVSNGGDDHRCDGAVWADARLIYLPDA